MTEHTQPRRGAGAVALALLVAGVIALALLAFSIGSALADDGSAAAAATQSRPSYELAQDEADPPAAADEDCPFGRDGEDGGSGSGGSGSSGTSDSVNY